MRRPTMTWRRLDRDGREAVTIAERPDGWLLAGVVDIGDTNGPSSLAYTIECDGAWQTRSCEVVGFIGERPIAVSIHRAPTGAWTADGVEAPAVAGCIDIDLAFSPVTNLLPIRRLALMPGDASQVRAAWLRFPELTLEVLEQTYTRTAIDHYRYESNGGGFSRELTVDGMGLVVDYPGLWASITPDPHDG